MIVMPERRQGDSSLARKIVEIERASQNKSQFLAVASHDLRQPVHALGLYIAELRRRVSGAEQQLLVGQVERSVEAMSTLLDALLDISKLDAGVVVPQKQVCELAPLLARLAADFKLAAHNKNIRLVVPETTACVYSDPLLLERILTNLLSNALRYTPPQGSVLVVCRRRKHQVLIEVRDNGIGIDAAGQSRIFREFIQLNQMVVDGDKGLGLGLAIVDRLVRLLGHGIALRSASGRGSTFTLKLPRSSMPADVFVLHEPPADSPAGKKVLVVDSDALVLDGTATILDSWGYQVTALTSFEALQKCLEEGASWDLVISGYRLDQRATGLDVIKTVRLYSNRQTPCILISGDTRPEVQKQAERAGHQLLHKPVKPAKLRSLMQYYLGSGLALTH